MLGQFCTGTTNADLVGIEIKLAEAYVPKAGLLGYDVIDGECSTSIITNWGTDKENLNQSTPNIQRINWWFGLSLAHL